VLKETTNQTFRRLRSDAARILDACLKAADPEKAVRRFVHMEGGHLVVMPDTRIDVSQIDRVLVVGAGKGSAPMAKALEDILGDRVAGGVLCVKYGHGLPLKRIAVMEGAHPVPDEAGREAANAIIDLLNSAGKDDLIISCISGGGSALLPAPAEGVTLEQKQDLTRRLLAVGATIHEINAVRKHFSLSKGGNLMQVAYPAFVVNLMLSDVVGDDPATIASGPFVPDDTTFQQVWTILNKYGLTSEIPSGMARRLQEGVSGQIPETPKVGNEIFSRACNVAVGSNILSLKAGLAAAQGLGYATLILSSSIEGDTSEAALFHAAIAREIRGSGNPIPSPACVLSGGETTVVLRGKGLGGRNQEFALALVREAAVITDSLFLSAGSDGTDGPTDAAGALVDSGTLDRALADGLDPDRFLENNDSYHFFEPLGDLVMTGPTRTNVMDIRIVLVA